MVSAGHDVGTPAGQVRWLAGHHYHDGTDWEMRAQALATLRAAGRRAGLHGDAHRPGPSPMPALLLLALLDRAEAGEPLARRMLAELRRVGPSLCQWCLQTGEPR